MEVIINDKEHKKHKETKVMQTACASLRSSHEISMTLPKGLEVVVENPVANLSSLVEAVFACRAGVISDVDARNHVFFCRLRKAGV